MCCICADCVFGFLQSQSAPAGGVTGLLGSSVPLADVPEGEESATAVGPSSSVDSVELLGNRQSLFEVASSIIRRVGTIEATEADAGVAISPVPSVCYSLWCLARGSVGRSRVEDLMLSSKLLVLFVCHLVTAPLVGSIFV
jgi:hypothetical protein